MAGSSAPTSPQGHLHSAHPTAGVLYTSNTHTKTAALYNRSMWDTCGAHFPRAIHSRHHLGQHPAAVPGVQSGVPQLCCRYCRHHCCSRITPSSASGHAIHGSSTAASQLSCVCKQCSCPVLQASKPWVVRTSHSHNAVLLSHPWIQTLHTHAPHPHTRLTQTCPS